MVDRLLLDTVTLSAIRRPDRQTDSFREFLGSVDLRSAYLSAVTLTVIRFGIEAARGRDRTFAAILSEWLETIRADFTNRILPFDEAVALCCGTLPTPDRRLSPDAMIGATALVHGLTVATRNVRDFEPLGVAVVDPWGGPPETTGR